jgi:predicted peptidase
MQALIRVVVLIGLTLAQITHTQAQQAPFHDPLYQTTGTQHRTYYFKEADDHIPYRLYVPSNWTPTSNMPLLIWINPTLDIDLPFVRRNNILEKLAEERGYILAVPSGYERPRPFFNSPYPGIRVNPNPNQPDPEFNRPERVLERDRSEQDIINVTDIVAEEFNVPNDRIYMFSNSSGGIGVWYLAHEHADKFAAVGVSSAPINIDSYPMEKIQNLPFLVVHGEADDTYSYDAARKNAETLKSHGLPVEFLSVPGGTHLEAWCDALPQILDFFDKHRKL